MARFDGRSGCNPRRGALSFSAHPAAPDARTVGDHAVLQRHQRPEARWPVQLWNAGLIVIGDSIGGTVTFETIRQVIENLPGMVATTLLTVLFCLGTGYII